MTNATIHKLECRKTGNYEKPLQTNAPRSFLPPLTRGRTSRRSSTVINPKRTHTHTHTHTHTGASAALHARASVSRQAGTRAPLGTLAAHPHPATPHGRAGRSPRPPARPPGKRWLPGWGQGRGRGGGECAQGRASARLKDILSQPAWIKGCGKEHTKEKDKIHPREGQDEAGKTDVCKYSECDSREII